eukprot:3900948-Rhodomonas_salina.1
MASVHFDSVPDECEHADCCVSFLLKEVVHLVSHFCETQVHLEGDIPLHPPQHVVQLLTIFKGVGQISETPRVV